MEKYKDNEDCFVEEVRMLGNDNGDQIAQRAQMKLRMIRNPIIGDKFSSRHGQKGMYTCVVCSRGGRSRESSGRRRACSLSAPVLCASTLFLSLCGPPCATCTPDYDSAVGHILVLCAEDKHIP